VRVALIILLTGCGSNAALEVGGRTLQTIQVSTDTAWAVAVEAALREERAYVEGLDPSTTPHAEAEAKLAEIRAHWDGRFAAFRAVREAHALAVEVFEDFRDDEVGYETFIGALDNVLRLYRELRALLPALPEV
jgi:hypothetical protein